MTNSVIYYVLESAVCLSLFLIVYRMLLANLTHFSWMRVYLLISVILSLILPLIVIPIHWQSLTVAPAFYNNIIVSSQINSFPSAQSLNSRDFNNQQLIPGMIFGFYVIGLLYRSYNLARNLRSIRTCIRQNQKVRDGRYWLVNLDSKTPPFSFFNYIFIANTSLNLSTDELERIKDHEKIHAREFHSIDVLFIEIVSILFWFNPLWTYLKKSIQDIHEFIVDEKIVERGNEKKGYAELLLKLSYEVKGFSLSAGFSNSQINRRIVMISKRRSLRAKKYMVTILVPITLFLMLSFSYIKNDDSQHPQAKQNEDIIQDQLKIGKIVWKGNTVCDIKTLNDAFGLKEGSSFSKELVEERLYGTDAVADLYLNNGYLFSKVSLTQLQKKNTMDLTISIYEGMQAKFNDVFLKVNGTVALNNTDNLGIKKGDLFSKTKVLNAVRSLAATGKYDAEKIRPIPVVTNIIKDNYAYMDFVFELTELNAR